MLGCRPVRAKASNIRGFFYAFINSLILDKNKYIYKYKNNLPKKELKATAKFILALVLALLLAWAVRTFAFTVFTVPQGGLPPQLEEGDRVIVNRVDCDNFGRGDIIVFVDSVVIQRRKIISEAYYIGRIEKMPGDTITLDTLRYVIPTECCKRCGCKDCRFYLVRTSRRGQQLVHKHQMIGKAYKLF